jgi:predicted ATPase
MTEPVADDGAPASAGVPFISRVRLKNYKSIASCDVRLGPLTILVGPNGSGKSNFLDALAFLSRAVATTPAEAIESRGGLKEILRRVPDQAESFTIAIEATIPAQSPNRRVEVVYEFEIGFPKERGRRGFEVISEVCELRSNGQTWRFYVSHGRVKIEPAGDDAAVAFYGPDRLYLLVAGGQAPYDSLYSGLRTMPFFKFVPDVIRAPQRPTTGATLGLRGEHLGDVLTALTVDFTWYKERIDAYLQSIAPGVASIDPLYIDQYVTVSMQANTGVDGDAVEFSSSSMSDGTIRAAAVLAALFQPWTLEGQIRLIGIEEPELALHPAAAGALFDALTEASEHVQVIATSQSAELLDREDLDVSMIRPVVMEDGVTSIGEVDSISREIAEEKLYTLGELMRRNQLSPEPYGSPELSVVRQVLPRRHVAS